MKYKFDKPITPEMDALIRRSGSNNYEVARAAQMELAKALETPLKKGVLRGNSLNGIYETIRFQPGAAVEFPLDFLAPGTEKDFVAFTMPNTGRIPELAVQGDYIMVSTYDIAAAIDCALKYLRDARWDVMGRMMQVLEAMFIRKMNNDGWRTILAAGVNRNLSGYDGAATSGLFTKRLVSILAVLMKRNAGGNATSLGGGKMTDLYVSSECVEDMRSWDLTQIDDMTRRSIYVAEDLSNMKVFGVNIHELYELGVAQEYQNYFANVLGGTLSTDKVEIVVGLDLQNNDSFVMPMRQDVEIWEDPALHRSRRAGLYGTAEVGFAVLDSRRVLIGNV